MANLEVLTRADNRYGTGDPLVVPKEGCSRRRARTQGRGGDGQGGNWAAEFGLLLSPCKMNFDQPTLLRGMGKRIGHAER